MHREFREKPVLILGNGNSLRNLNYASLPAEIDIFRVNQFYFEDLYFAGKGVDIALIAANFAVHEKFFTLQNLRDRGEYTIGQVVFQESNSGIIEVEEIERFYPQVARLSNLILADKEMWWWGDFVYRQYVAYGQGPTNGVNLIALALSMGYNKIYVGGIDFYVSASSDLYGFPMQNKRALGKFIPSEQMAVEGYNHWHSISVDLFVVEKCKEIIAQRGGFIYNVGIGSPLSKILVDAPNLPQGELNLGEQAGVKSVKPLGYIDDIMLMPKLYLTHFKRLTVFKELKLHIKNVLHAILALVKVLLKFLNIYIYIGIYRLFEQDPKNNKS